MVTRILKWGNSLGLRIPRALAAEARVREGAAVDLSLQDGRLIVRPVPRGRYDLRTLLSGVRAEHLHPEVDTGTPRGREAR